MLRALGGAQADDVEPRRQGLEVPFHREGRFPERICGRTGAVGGGGIGGVSGEGRTHELRGFLGPTNQGSK